MDHEMDAFARNRYFALGPFSTYVTLFSAYLTPLPNVSHILTCLNTPPSENYVTVAHLPPTTSYVTDSVSNVNQQKDKILS